LIGAHALGIHNILALTGDPPAMGTIRTRPRFMTLTRSGWWRHLELNGGRGSGGQSDRIEYGVFDRCRHDPTAESLDREVERLEAQGRRRAQFAMTQPLYDLAVLEGFLQSKSSLEVAPFAGTATAAILPTR